MYKKKPIVFFIGLFLEFLFQNFSFTFSYSFSSSKDNEGDVLEVVSIKID